VYSLRFVGIASRQGNDKPLRYVKVNTDVDIFAERSRRGKGIGPDGSESGCGWWREGVSSRLDTNLGTRPPRVTCASLTHVLRYQHLIAAHGSKIVLKSLEPGKQIKDAGNLALMASGYDSEAAAREEGVKLQDVLRIVFARARCGVDFGDGTGPRTGLTEHGRELLRSTCMKEMDLAPDTPILGDSMGLTVFKTQPQPRFLWFTARGVIAEPKDAFCDSVSRVYNARFELSEEQRLAYSVFASSFDQEPNTRLVTLVTAVECLIRRQRRSKIALEHIDRLLEQTRNSTQ